MDKKNGFGPEDWDGDGKIDDYDEMMELRMFEKISKIVASPGFDIFEDSKHEGYLDDEDDDYDEFDDDEFDEDFDDDWDSDDF